MENDFFELYERHGFLNISIGHNNCADWCLEIIDRKKSKVTPVISCHDCVRKGLFADAYCNLTSYLSDNYGGY